PRTRPGPYDVRTPDPVARGLGLASQGRRSWSRHAADAMAGRCPLAVPAVPTVPSPADRSRSRDVGAEDGVRRGARCGPAEWPGVGETGRRGLGPDSHLGGVAAW